MNQPIETDLKEAFSAHLSRIPDDAIDRLRGIDYHPRTIRLSPRATVGAIGGAAATTAAIVSAVALTSASPAFAGWRASPTHASSGPTGSANATCQSHLASLPGIPPPSSWSPVVTDVRGPFTLVVYRDDRADATCLTGPSVIAVSETSGLGGTNGHASSIGLGGSVRRAGSHQGASSWSSSFNLSGSVPIQQISVDHLSVNSQGAYTVAEGKVGSEVTAVTLVLGDRNDVQTTTSRGWFVAWWPGHQDPVSAQVTTPGGTTRQPLNPPPDGGLAKPPSRP
jgi:hypothetical protein